MCTGVGGVSLSEGFTETFYCVGIIIGTRCTEPLDQNCLSGGFAGVKFSRRRRRAPRGLGTRGAATDARLRAQPPESTPLSLSPSPARNKALVVRTKVPSGSAPTFEGPLSSVYAESPGGLFSVRQQQSAYKGTAPQSIKINNENLLKLLQV